MNEGRGLNNLGADEEGSGRRAGSGDMHPFIPSCQCKGGVVAGAAAAILAGLQPLQGTWSLGLSLKCFSSYTMIPKKEEKEKENPCHKEEGWIM